MDAPELKPNHIVRGAMFPEPVKILTIVPLGEAIKLIGEGLETGRVHQPILTAEQIATLEISPDTDPFDGDPARFRLGVEAMRLGLAYEYDPYFSLSIARVDPLPHQFEAVYDYFLKLPRIRFLLADDPGAGKTIMAGLLIKELKVRGLIQRILIVTPANLSFQWQRELKDKFRETFQVVRSDILRATYGANPWQDIDQVITSVSWVSRIEDAKESLHAQPVGPDHRGRGAQDECLQRGQEDAGLPVGGSVVGDDRPLPPDDRDAAQGRPRKLQSLSPAAGSGTSTGTSRAWRRPWRRRAAPFYLRRVKEALVTFPDPDTGEAKSLFTKRHVHTAGFQIDDDELDFYDRLTRYVEDQSFKAAQDNSARGRALGFTMAMLQRRFASSVYAVRRTLERMQAKRAKILENPEAYRQEQLKKRLPDDFDDLPEEEQEEILGEPGGCGRLYRSGGLARGDRGAGETGRAGPGPGGTRNRDETHQAARGHDGGRHLQRSKDEAAALYGA